MLNFEEELKKFKPSLEVEEIEKAVRLINDQSMICPFSYHILFLLKSVVS